MWPGHEQSTPLRAAPKQNNSTLRKLGVDKLSASSSAAGASMRRSCAPSSGAGQSLLFVFGRVLIACVVNTSSSSSSSSNSSSPPSSAASAVLGDERGESACDVEATLGVRNELPRADERAFSQCVGQGSERESSAMAERATWHTQPRRESTSFRADQLGTGRGHRIRLGPLRAPRPLRGPDVVATGRARKLRTRAADRARTEVRSEAWMTTARA
jgi:hypothetical protein